MPPAKIPQATSLHSGCGIAQRLRKMSKLSTETTAAASSADSSPSQARTQSPPVSSQLRSDAVSFEVPVKLRGSKATEIAPGITRHTEPFEERARSIIVFRHGGVLRMSTPVSPGQLLVLTNLKSAQDAICRVVKVQPHLNSVSYVEVEFTHPQPGYWGVYFSPAMAKTPQEAASSSSTTPEIAAKNSTAAPGNTFVANLTKPGSDDSTFVPLGSQDVQPAASSTSSATVPPARAVRLPQKSTDHAAVTGPQVQAPPVAAGLSNAPTRTPVSSADSSTARTKEQEADDLVADQTLTKASPHSTPLAETTGSFGSRLGARSEKRDPTGGRNWILIAACGGALFVAIGGFLLFHHKPADIQSTSVQPVAQAPVTQPAETQSATVAITTSAAKPSPAPTARVHDAPVAVTQEPGKGMAIIEDTHTYSKVEAPAPSPAHSVKSTVPSVFGAFNAHPVTTPHTTTTAPPNIDSAVVPPIAENTLLGITSTTSATPLLPAALTGNVPIPAGGQIRKPQAVSRVLPQYPDAARRMRAQGDVVVEIVIEKSGSVSEAKAISGPPLLRQAAVDAVRRWKYDPTMLDGQPIAVQMTVTVQFHL